MFQYAGGVLGASHRARCLEICCLCSSISCATVSASALLQEPSFGLCLVGELGGVRQRGAFGRVGRGPIAS